jgi:hypothetical protein
MFWAGMVSALFPEGAPSMNRTQSWIVASAALAFAAFGVSEAQAQAAMQRPAPTRTASGAAFTGPVRIRQFTGHGPRALVKIPDVFGRGRAAARDWAEMQVVFDSEPEWMDEVTLQYYALLYDRTAGEYTILKGLVLHVDVARGKNHMSSAYIRPNTLARYGEVVAVAVEVLYKGEVVATQSEGKLAKSQPLPVDWWKNPKLVVKDGLVLTKAQTPFAYVSYDDYEAVK